MFFLNFNIGCQTCKMLLLHNYLRTTNESRDSLVVYLTERDAQGKKPAVSPTGTACLTAGAIQGVGGAVEIH